MAPLQAYSSALVYVPERSTIKQQFLDNVFLLDHEIASNAEELEFVFTDA